MTTDMSNTREDEVFLLDTDFADDIENGVGMQLVDENLGSGLDWQTGSMFVGEEDPDHGEIQDLLLDLDDIPSEGRYNNMDSLMPAPTSATRSFVGENRYDRSSMEGEVKEEAGYYHSADSEIKNFENSSNFEIIPASSRVDSKFQNNFTANNMPVLTSEAQDSPIDPNAAKEARKKRKETIQRRRGRAPSTPTAYAPSQSCRNVAEEAVAAVSSHTSAISMADVQKTAQQLLGDMKYSDTLFSAGAFRRTVSLNAIRPPSPVYSSNATSVAREPTSSISDDIKSDANAKPQLVTSSSIVPDKVVSSNKKRSKSVPAPRKRTQKKSTLPAELAAIVKPRRTNKKKATEPTPLEMTVAAIESTPLPEGDDPESRRQRRLIRNRMSAQLHRERKREAMNTLQRMIEERDDRIQTLEKELHEAQNKNYSLEGALTFLRGHFGESAIQKLVGDGSSAASLPPSSPPHLVNGSDLSTCTSEDDSSTSCTPPLSPKSEGLTDTTLPTPSASGVNSTASFSSENDRKRSANGGVVPSKQKRKKSRAGLATIVPIAFCGFLACLAIIPYNRTAIIELQMTGSVEVINQEGRDDVSRSQVSMHNHGFNTDMRRRLLSATSSKSGESLLSRFSPEETTEDHDWLISPIETFPSLWKVNHALSIAPWTFKSSELLFDLRSHALTSSMSSFEAVESPSAAPSNDPQKEKPVINNGKIKTPEIRLRGTMSRERRNATSYTENKHKTNDSISSDQNGTGSEELTSYRSKAISILDNSEDASATTNHNIGEDSGVGSSFMFCPSAHSNLSPEFLQLSDPKNLSEDGSDAPSKDTKGGPIVVNTNKQRNMDTRAIIKDKKVVNDDSSKALVPAFENEFVSSGFPVDHKTGYNRIINGDYPHMRFLLPASAVPSFGMSTGGNDPWIELGCQVLSARIVNDVSFVEDDDELQNSSAEENVL